MRRLSLYATVLGAVFVSGGTSQPPPTPSAEPEIVVRGMATNDAHSQARKFTRSQAGGLIARWTNMLCFSVQGLAPAQSTMLLSRIKQNTESVGIRTIEDQPCTWNVLIAFTTDADGFAANLVANHPGLFRDYFRYGLASHHELTTLAAPRPVRWLPVERVVGAVGSGASVEEASHIDDGSHISTNSRGDKIAELIIVDPKRIDGLSWQQLADYISMVLLTDPEMDEHFADDRTIMSLFPARDRGEKGPPGLTDEDRQLLRGYYAFDPYQPPAQQIETIASSLKIPPPKDGKTRTVP
jgi:hypothetical protein